MAGNKNRWREQETILVKRDGRGDCRIVALLDSIEQGCASCPIPWMAFNQIDEGVGVDADKLTHYLFRDGG